jgi:hypothetical protein
MELSVFPQNLQQQQALAQLQWGERSALTSYTVGLPTGLQQQLINASLQLVAQAMHSTVLTQCKALAPAALLLGDAPPHTEFFTVDFALTAATAATEPLQPRLIELQAFPSFYAYALWREQLCGTPPSELPAFTERWQQFAALFTRTASETGAVVMLDISPATQPSGFCFELMARCFDVQPVALAQLYRRGSSLYYQNDSGEQQISVIYNRLIIDSPALASQCRQLFADAEVRWIGHPDWFYLLGKQVLPYLQHPLVPACRFVEVPLAAIKADEVLKPLFGYGGQQVLLHPTTAQIGQLSAGRWLAQQRQQYQPCLTIDSKTRLYCEIRLLCCWPATDSQPHVTAILARSSDNPVINTSFRTNSAAGTTIAHGSLDVA